MGKLSGKKLIECKASSDVAYFVASRAQAADAIVLVEVMDADSCNTSDATPLITAQLLPSQAIRLARALLMLAGAQGTIVGNAQTFTFID